MYPIVLVLLLNCKHDVNLITELVHFKIYTQVTYVKIFLCKKILELISSSKISLFENKTRLNSKRLFKLQRDHPVSKGI